TYKWKRKDFAELRDNIFAMRIHNKDEKYIEFDNCVINSNRSAVYAVVCYKIVGFLPFQKARELDREEDGFIEFINEYLCKLRKRIEGTNNG
ncbi:MAG: hypothetical protein K6G30_13045, partial [Acetatifactor sp.]|nr:hypothetical protein [Acetatifactor sp.]